MPNFQTTLKLISCLPLLLALGLFSWGALTTASLAHENDVAGEQNATGRYSMLQTENGIIRPDRETGAMTSCKTGPEGWICTPLKQQKNTDLETNQTVENLKAEIKRLEQRLAERGDDKIDDLDKKEKSLKLPTDEEVDEAIEYMEKMIRKFGGAMKRLREKPDEDEIEL